MKGIITVLILALLLGCKDSHKNETSKNEVKEAEKDSVEVPGIKNLEDQLKKDGYQTFSYKDGDTTYLMQQYYVVFLKSGPNRSQDSTEAAELQEKHLAHLSRLYNEGYTSLTGPMGDDGKIRGIVVFNTPTQKEADSLARLDPMVKAGRLEVEVHPWWVAKGGKLN
ncbi:YciI family protein [Gramella jeungdoensis]|uniref:YciI family protein n=1 Tax=Gramella jeungdoensis TaxID=708091 RepID=A0ABT0Z2Y3_9FLAO|nr:YciI family protein [Gramella jeungdoensis]MCM8569755.1 YciI family protein [Gramella jeungdoensis]